MSIPLDSHPAAPKGDCGPPLESPESALGRLALVSGRKQESSAKGSSEAFLRRAKRVAERIDFLLCGEAGKAHAQSPIHNLVFQPHSRENMAPAALFARRAFRDTDIPRFQKVHEHLATVSGQGEAEDMGRAAG